MILDAPTKILQLIATETCDVTVSGHINDTGRPSFSEETKATASTQTICLAPGRLPKDIENITIVNTGGIGSFTVQSYDSSGAKTTKLASAILAVDEFLEYTLTNGWSIPDVNVDAIMAALIGGNPVWVKVGDALAYSAFSAAALFKTNTLFSLVAGGMIHGIKIEQSTAFAGTAITEVTAEVGIAAITDKYGEAFDILQAVGPSGLSQRWGIESRSAATDILITVRTVGANTSALTAGVLNVWALLSKAP